jgi:hypothetical protein
VTKPKRNFTELTAARRARSFAVSVTIEEYGAINSTAKREGLSIAGLIREALTAKYGIEFGQRALNMRNFKDATKEQQAIYLRRKLAELGEGV